VVVRVLQTKREAPWCRGRRLSREARLDDDDDNEDAQQNKIKNWKVSYFAASPLLEEWSTQVAAMRESQEGSSKM
jgi:hypothetical protein